MSIGHGKEQNERKNDLTQRPVKALEVCVRVELTYVNPLVKACGAKVHHRGGKATDTLEPHSIQQP
jgi:hypothetical protein